MAETRRRALIGAALVVAAGLRLRGPELRRDE